MPSPTTSRRIVVTGLGVVSPLGNSKESLWEGLSNGQSGVRLYDDFSSDAASSRFAAPASEFTGTIADFGELEKDQKKMIRKALKIMCRETMMGVAVAQSALQDAGITTGALDPERSGCIFGTDSMVTMPDDLIAGIKACKGDDGEFEYESWGGRGLGYVTPLWLLRYLPNMPASHVAIYNDLRGPNNSLTLREAAANMAVGEAYFTIARGSADMIVTGATGTRIHPMNAIRAMQQEETANGEFAPEQASRPFDRDRSGMVLGEGAGAVILEEFESAKARNAPIYGEIVARGSSTAAASNSVADRKTALQNAIRATLRDAKMDPGDVGHIHAHGLSTRSGDREEAAAIAEIFGDPDHQQPVVAAKSYFGNLGAGSGMIELISSLLALQHDKLFPILNYENADPECPVAAVRSDDASPGHSFVNHSVTPQAQAAAILVRAVA